MKKLSAIMMSSLLLFGLAACGNEQKASDGGGSKASPAAESKTSENSAGASSAAETENQGGTDGSEADDVKTENPESGKTLVVYYSASGNTKEAAECIAAATGGDLFELEPEDTYTDEDLDWTDEDSRVCREHENEEERNVALVSTEAPGWDSYETVFVGYPIWWGIAAWPVNGFITANDFSGKTVIPFCTSASSGLGESGELLQEMAGTGNWLEGERFSSGASEEDVKTWVDSLGL